MAVPALHAVRAPVVLVGALLAPGWALLRLVVEATGAASRSQDRPCWEDGALALGLGLTWLMLAGLAVDELPGGGHRLTTGWALALVNIGVAGPSAAVVLLARRHSRTSVSTGGLRLSLRTTGPAVWSRRQLRFSLPLAWATGWRALLGPALAAGAVGAAVLGARQLNGGGGPGWSATALVLVASALWWRISGLEGAESPRARAAADGVSLYLCGVAVLLLTALRGAGVEGHDVATEYRLFLDTAHARTWHPGGLFPGYDSCLSITILPTLLWRLLGTSSDDIFRVVLQLVAATTVPIVYAVGRRFAGRRLAVAGAALFLSFPTFINDLAWIVRQEVAFVLFFLAVLCVLDRTRPAARRTALLLVLGAGTVVAHYATTWVGFLTLVVAGIGTAVTGRRSRAGGILRAPVLVALLAASVGWGAWTGTADGLANTVRATVHDLTSGVGVRDAATGYSFIDRPAPLPPRRALAEFVESQRRADPRLFGRTTQSPAPSCRPRVAAPDTIATSQEGRSLGQGSRVAARLAGALRDAAAALFEIGALLGLVVLWRRRRARVPGHLEAMMLTLGNGLLLVLVVVLPYLSVSYGLLRLYQQALVVLAPVIAVAVGAGLRRLGGVAAGGRWALGAVVAGTFLVTSGAVPQVLGASGPQLDLNNSGSYYDAYYVGPAAVAVAKWTAEHQGTTPVVTDLEGATALRAGTSTNPAQGVYPGLTPAGAVVVARTADGPGGGRAVRATFVYDDEIASYRFPIGCLGSRRILFHQGNRVVLSPVITR